MISQSKQNRSHVNYIFGYGRGSTDKQVLTLGMQEQKVEEWVGLNRKPGREEYAGFFADKAVSSDHQWECRPMGVSIMSRVRAGDTIVVHTSDRMLRNVAEGLHVIDDVLGKCVGVKLVFMDIPLDLNTPMGRLVFTVRESVAEFEKNLIGVRTREVKAFQKAKGRPTGGGNPVGWKNTGRRPNIRYRPDDYARRCAAEITRLHYEMGLSWIKIQKYLFQKSLLNPQGKAWTHTAAWRASKAHLKGFPLPNGDIHPGLGST